MISLSNLLKQQYVVNLGTETRIINADDRFKTDNVVENSAPSSEEIIDGFLAGLEVEEVQVEPEVKPEEILAQARAEADGILVAARLEAEKMADNAKMQVELLYEQKKQQGYQEGVSKLQDEVLEHRAKLQAEFDEKNQILQAEYESKLDALEADMVDVMIRVFHKVFNVQFDNKKQILLHLIKDTLLGIDAGKNFIVRVAEANYKFIESHVADIKEKIGNDVSIDVVNDMNLEEDDCIIETPTGVYNCGIDMVLSNLEKDIRSICR